jgi:4-hydroxy-4-methyl-2-oxoglutarate aldolase
LVESGQVLIAQLSGDIERGHWGELMSIAAQFRGVAGLVVDGAIRDTAAITVLRFPVFHRGTHPVAADKKIPGELQVPLTIGGVAIAPGDWVFADDDGIVIVPLVHVEDVIDAAAKVDVHERVIAQRLAAGETTVRALALEAIDGPP